MAFVHLRAAATAAAVAGMLFGSSAASLDRHATTTRTAAAPPAGQSAAVAHPAINVASATVTPTPTPGIPPPPVPENAPPRTVAAVPQPARSAATDVVVGIDSAMTGQLSRLSPGVTHTQHSLDPWEAAPAVARGQTL